MKKLRNILVVFLMLVCITGCGNETKEESKKTYTIQDKIVIDGTTCTFDHLKMTIPKGFKIYDSGDNKIVVPENYPEVTDNINFVKTSADSISNYSKEFFEEYYSESFDFFEGIKTYKETKISGHDAIVMSYSFTYEGINMTQYQYLIFGSNYSDIMTITSVSGLYDKDFEKLGDSLEVLD